MDEDTEMAAWAQLEQEQEQLRADPAFNEWLDFIEACASHEKEIEHGDYCR